MAVGYPPSVFLVYMQMPIGMLSNTNASQAASGSVTRSVHVRASGTARGFAPEVSFLKQHTPPIYTQAQLDGAVIAARKGYLSPTKSEELMNELDSAVREKEEVKAQLAQLRANCKSSSSDTDHVLEFPESTALAEVRFNSDEETVGIVYKSNANVEYIHSVAGDFTSVRRRFEDAQSDPRISAGKLAHELRRNGALVEKARKSK